ncbi:S-adenosyl-L-methionine-dependent methyltransferase [Myriangium duriaei CBS 260.36]|uniref:DNA (cytosine-5-)-methyltransferase n=1 Tax=Myriangium duriaei CBS 260.36 TaxID=1168546 RepID=A0A9P4IZ07_9PEZI|nr:S-adenosyl-L-methionine-dependent methyltransferase [Myriangium duriaei CBS 260.36]
MTHLNADREFSRNRASLASTGGTFFADIDATHPTHNNQRPQAPSESTDDNESSEEADIELLHESSAQVQSRVTRHLQDNDFHRLFPSFTVSDDWTKIDRDTFEDVAIGDFLFSFNFKCFIRVFEMYRNLANDRAIVIRGVRYRKLADLSNQLESDNDEVTMIQEHFTDSIPNQDGVFLECFTYQDIQPIVKKQLILTNKLRATQFQKLRLTDDPSTPEHILPQFPIGHVICRSKHTVVFKSRSNERRSRKDETMFMNLSDREVDAKYRIDDRRFRIQGHKIRKRFPSADGKIFAYDCFAGAGLGGVGLKKAGAIIICAFDREKKAVKTYRLNHPEVRVLQKEFSKVIKECESWDKVDLLLITFPCQPWSPVHTVRGKNDEANQAVLFGLSDFLAKMKPRAIVMEQTFGFEHAKHENYMKVVIAAFRNNDYSVRMKVMNFGSLGEASERKRLIFYAAAPGERLPSFPEEIFNANFEKTKPHLHRAVSILDRLQEPFVPSSHNFYDPRVTKTGTMTTHGLEKPNNHWTGRPWEPDQLKVLQGAPNTFHLDPSLSKSDKMRQLGNAFPSIAAEAICRQVVESLRRTDADDRKQDNLESGAGLRADYAIIIDDDGEEDCVELDAWPPHLG